MGALRCADGFAAGDDLGRAALSAADAALAGLGPGGDPPELGCIFLSAPDADQGAAAAALGSAALGATVTIGCVVTGVLGAGRAVEREPAASVWVAHLPGARLRPFHLDVRRAGEGLAVVGLPDPEPDDTAMLLLADPYTFPVDGFVEQTNDALPGLPVVGGLASGPAGAGSARLLLDGTTRDRGAVGVVLGGSVAVSTLVSQGCRPVGPPMTVTAADGNVLAELAGVPALEKLQQVVGALAPEEQRLVAAGLHIGIAMDEYADEHGRGDFLVRGVVGADPASRGLVVGDLVEVGRTVQFQVRDADTADADLAGLLERFRLAGGPVDGALLFSCNGRGGHLFDSAAHDVSAVRHGLGAHAVAGFFAAGEIGPVGGRNHLHGFTASMLAFGGDGA